MEIYVVVYWVIDEMLISGVYSIYELALEDAEHLACSAWDIQRFTLND